MSSAAFTISAFGDEIAADLREQLKWLRELKIGYLELRGAWRKNVLYLEDDEAAAVHRLCDEHQIVVSCIGSPIGKSPIVEPVERELTNLWRIFQIAEVVGTRRVRIFSFYPPNSLSNTDYDEYVEVATARLAQLTLMAEREDFYLLLENEKDIVGDTPERCQALLGAIDSQHLRFAWDPANFVQVGVTRPMDQGWPLLSDYVGYVHVKDALSADGRVRAAGEGDGQVRELLLALRRSNYRGFLALEPHLAIAGRSGGFSGPEGMRYAVSRLRQLMSEAGCVEQPAGSGSK